MADTGWKYPTGAYFDSGNVWYPGSAVWDNTKVQAIDSSYMESDRTDYGAWARFGNFNFGIPPADIDGIEAQVYGRLLGDPATFNVSLAISEDGGSSWNGPGPQTWTTATWAWKTFGSPTYLWGTSSLTPTLLDSSQFQMRIIAWLTGVTGTSRGQIDALWVKVYYTPWEELKGVIRGASSVSGLMLPNYSVSYVSNHVEQMLANRLEQFK